MPSSPSDPNQTVDESAAPSGGEDTGAGRERTAAVHELRRDPSRWPWPPWPPSPCPAWTRCA